MSFKLIFKISFKKKASHSVVSRADRFSGQHGGLLIAHNQYHRCDLHDFTSTMFTFSIACIMTSKHITHLFVLIYNPPKSSPYNISVTSLIDCLSHYFTKLSEWCYKHQLPLSEISVVGDFNLPDVLLEFCYLPICRRLRTSRFYDLERIRLTSESTNAFEGKHPRPNFYTMCQLNSIRGTFS